MSQLRQQKSLIEEKQLRVTVVTFDSGELARSYVQDTKLDWPLVLDTDQSLYRAYGLGRGNWWQLYGLPSIVKYLGLIVGGHRPGKPGKDWQQLGGDVLIDPDGNVRVHHISTSPHDRPSIESLMNIIQLD